MHFLSFQRAKIQNFGNQGATSGIYCVHYKPPVVLCLPDDGCEGGREEGGGGVNKSVKKGNFVTKIQKYLFQIFLNEVLKILEK